MMDPLSAISLADSVVGIVDVVSRTIKSLHNLSEPWKEADFAVTLLIAQLSALKAALNQISDGFLRTSLSTSSSPAYP
jgi:hypothetical protein